MMRRLGLAPALLALVACARAHPRQVAPAPAPPPEARNAPSAPVVAPAPPARPRCCAPDSSTVRPAAARSASPANRVSPVAPPPDPSQEEEFLDSLRALAADSGVVPVAQVAPEEVRGEVANLFGRPGAASSGIDAERYADHERVQYWMGFFSGRARWHFARYLERLGRYDSMIRGRLAAAELPQDLIYLAMIESGFNQIARSRAGAVGLWQFIPGTARRYGLTVDAWVDERRDPFLSTDAAVRFLSELGGRFGSLYLAAAAYNSGPGKIQRGLERGDYGTLNGDQAYFAMAEGSFLRRETRDYVPKLIAAALLAREPERYGFNDLVRWRPLHYDSVRVPYAVGLDVLARLAGTTAEVVEEMNARYFRGVTPPDRTVWVRVPAGTSDSVASRLAVLPARDRVTVVVHVVERGETLSRIAQRYGVAVEDIRLANHLRSTRLMRGQRLVVPTSHSRSWQRVAVRDWADRPVRRSRGSSRSHAAVIHRAAPAGRSPARGTVTTRRVHIVQPGESPWTIANRFGVPVSSLLEANSLTRRSLLHPGQAVRIPN